VGWDIEESVQELGSLASTAGAVVAGQVIQRKQKPDPSYYIGEGKAREVEMIRAATGASLVIFDDELSPAQQRNLEQVIEGRVIDRTWLILDIFAQRAATAEGKLQVELAQLEYMLPRLGGRGTELSRLGGGIGTRGPGESKLETDRRAIRSRISSIRRQIEEVRVRRGIQRRRRREANLATVSLVGYTNAGKSSLMNALTDARTVVEDKLFATLDPMTRRLELPDGQRILLTDTVGFIQKIPHHLVMAFRATLEEVTEADLLLHVVDVSHPRAQEHYSAVFGVLSELGAQNRPCITVLNKVDVAEAAALARFAHSYPKSTAVSALTGEGLEALTRMIAAELAGRRVRVDVALPCDDPLIALIRRRGRVISEDYDGDRISIRAEVDRALAGRIAKAGRIGHSGVDNG
jgi:GTP-binding protein HflX